MKIIDYTTSCGKNLIMAYIDNISSMLAKSRKTKPKKMNLKQQ